MTRLIGVFAAAAAVVLMSGTASPQDNLAAPFDDLYGALAAIKAEVIKLDAAMEALGSTVAVQQPQCPPRDVMLKKALDNYNEGPVQGGEMTYQDGSQYIFELLLSTKGSWTFIRTSIDGQTCAVASGTGWITTGEPPLPGDPT